MKELKQILVGISMLAAGSLAGAFIDVQNLKAEVSHLQSVLIEMKDDIKIIKNHLIGRK